VTVRRIVRCQCDEQRGVLLVIEADGSAVLQHRGHLITVTGGVADVACKRCGFSETLPLDNRPVMALTKDKPHTKRSCALLLGWSRQEGFSHAPHG